MLKVTVYCPTVSENYRENSNVGVLAEKSKKQVPPIWVGEWVLEGPGLEELRKRPKNVFLPPPMGELGFQRGLGMKSYLFKPNAHLSGGGQNQKFSKIVILRGLVGRNKMAQS